MNQESDDVLGGFEAFAVQLADEAREISLRYFRKKLDVETKSDESPVTIADREIEAHIRARLAQRFPGARHFRRGARAGANRRTVRVGYRSDRRHAQFRDGLADLGNAVRAAERR